MMVHTFKYLKSMSLKPGCAAPTSWSEHSTCFASKIYSKLLRFTFIFAGLDSPEFPGMGISGSGSGSGMSNLKSLENVAHFFKES